MLIAIEGVDGCGKHTQSTKLKEYLASLGRNVELLAFPNYENRGCEPVKMYLGGEFGGTDRLDCYQANALFAVDRLTTMIKYADHIKNGGDIIFDRYVTTSQFHQGSLERDPVKRKEFVEYIENFEYNILKLPRPDVVIFLNLDIDVSLALARSRKEYKSKLATDIYEEDEEYQRRTHKVALELAESLGWKIVNCCKDGKILSIDEIHNKILKVLEL
ncbi:MAG: thymidylate kinase [Clostridiales bacterium]|nr:thymidylate kinase [Clostridiales bacterium]